MQKAYSAKLRLRLMCLTSMAEYRSINLRFPVDLLDQVDQAAKTSGLDRSNWLRAAAFEKLNGSQISPSRDWELVHDVKTVDPRAREIIKDVLLRLERLEGAVFSNDKADPFA